MKSENHGWSGRLLKGLGPDPCLKPKKGVIRKVAGKKKGKKKGTKKGGLGY